MTAGGERIARRIARAGLCSRREAERWIGEGRVSVNGSVIGSPALNVGGDDAVLVDGRPLPAPPRVRLFRFHKPRGMVTTHSDPEGRPTVFSRLPPDTPLLHAVGRLDIDSEGLLLVTTDGALKRLLELPSTGLARIYRARCRGRADPARLREIGRGATIDGVRYGPVRTAMERPGEGGGSNAWLRVTIHEGKNREVRRALAHAGLQVSRLIRTGYGPFRLGALPRGAWSDADADAALALAGPLP